MESSQNIHDEEDAYNFDLPEYHVDSSPSASLLFADFERQVSSQQDLLQDTKMSLLRYSQESLEESRTHTHFFDESKLNVSPASLSDTGDDADIDEFEELVTSRCQITPSFSKTELMDKYRKSRVIPAVPTWDTPYEEATETHNEKITFAQSQYAQQCFKEFYGTQLIDEFLTAANIKVPDDVQIASSEELETLSRTFLDEIMNNIRQRDIFYKLIKSFKQLASGFMKQEAPREITKEDMERREQILAELAGPSEPSIDEVLEKFKTCSVDLFMQENAPKSQRPTLGECNARNLAYQEFKRRLDKTSEITEDDMKVFVQHFRKELVGKQMSSSLTLEYKTRGYALISYNETEGGYFNTSRGLVSRHRLENIFSQSTTHIHVLVDKHSHIVDVLDAHYKKHTLD